jgi:hypothetical protein
MTELYCSLRSLQIALEPDGVVLARRRKACPLAPRRRSQTKSVSARSSSSLADEKRVRSLLLHPSARDLS